MGQGSEPDDVAAELVRLREENARLRALLGFDARPADGHAVAWSPTLLSNPTSGPAIDAQSSNGAKLELFRSLFGARSDVYAVRWENASTGKSGWSPATRGGWSNQRRSRRDYLPLTDDVLASHLRGEATIGVYPLFRGDTCTLLACDFDRGSWVLDALAYLDACHAHGVPAALERSRSGDGGHVWIFFETPVPASEARALGAALLRQAMTSRAEMDLSSYDRFFPSQDFLPRAGFGNLIALPLQGYSARISNTVFLDPQNAGAMRGPVGVPVNGRSPRARRGVGAGGDATSGRRRTDGELRRPRPPGWPASAARHPRLSSPDDCRSNDRACRRRSSPR